MSPSDAGKPDDATTSADSTDTPDPQPTSGSDRQTLPSGTKINVEYRQTPPAPPAEKQIHPRRPLPMTPEAPAGDK